MDEPQYRLTMQSDGLAARHDSASGESAGSGESHDNPPASGTWTFDDDDAIGAALAGAGNTCDASYR